VIEHFLSLKKLPKTFFYYHHHHHQYHSENKVKKINIIEIKYKNLKMIVFQLIAKATHYKFFFHDL